VTHPSSAKEITWVTFGQVGSPMGLQHYESELLRALAREDNPEFTFRARRFGGMRAPGDLDVRFPRGLLTRAPTAVARLVGARAHRRSRYVHRFDLRLPPPACPEVVTVHDLPPLRFPDEGDLPEWSIMSARRSQLVICPSEFAAQEVSDLLHVRRITVIPNGVNDAFRDPAPMSEAELADVGIRPPFILHAGGASERKNLVSLAAAWRSVATVLPGHSLVLVGPPDQRRDTAFAGAERTTAVGYLEAPIVARLMASADAVVVPSTYEGFGLPALEAMSAGTPVVAALAGALPEVCGDAGLLVAPTPAGLANGIEAVCLDPPLRESLVRRGLARGAEFSWERCARGHLAAYADAFG
jgi:alpha-1,3-rhamnosyl/mannosyltransferase